MGAAVADASRQRGANNEEDGGCEPTDAPQRRQLAVGVDQSAAEERKRAYEQREQKCGLDAKTL